jgi:hypothetical protein
VNSTIVDPRNRNLLQSRSASEACDVEKMHRDKITAVRNDGVRSRINFCAQKNPARTANDARRFLFVRRNGLMQTDQNIGPGTMRVKLMICN